MNSNIDTSNFIFVTATIFKIRSDELYALACNILPMIKFADWRIIITDDSMALEEIKITEVRHYNRIIALAELTGNKVTFYVLGRTPVAHAKANIYKMVAGSNKWIMNIDDDLVFEKERLRTLINNINLFGGPRILYIYPMVDLYNGRGHGDYVGCPVNSREAKHLAIEHGDGLLGHLKLWGFSNSLWLDTSIGSGGFIVHSSAISNKVLTMLYRFSLKERGHDTLFCAYYEVKKVVVNSWAIHMRVDTPYYGEEWHTYNSEAQTLHQ